MNDQCPSSTTEPLTLPELRQAGFLWLVTAVLPRVPRALCGPVSALARLVCPVTPEQQRARDERAWRSRYHTGRYLYLKEEQAIRAGRMPASWWAAQQRRRTEETR